MRESSEKLVIDNHPVSKVLREFRNIDSNPHTNTDLLYQLNVSHLESFLFALESIYRKSPNALLAVLHTNILGINVSDESFGRIIDLLNNGEHSELLIKFLVIGWYRSNGNLSFLEEKPLGLKTLRAVNQIIHIFTQGRATELQTKPITNDILDTSELMDYTDALSVMKILQMHRSSNKVIFAHLDKCLNPTLSEKVVKANLKSLLAAAMGLKKYPSSDQYDMFFHTILYVISNKFPASPDGEDNLFGYRHILDKILEIPED